LKVGDLAEARAYGNESPLVYGCIQDMSGAIVLLGMPCGRWVLKKHIRILTTNEYLELKEGSYDYDGDPSP